MWLWALPVSISQSSLRLEPGVALGACLLEIRTRMGIAGSSHGSPTAILLCSSLTLALLPLRQLPAAHANFCSLISIFQSAAGSWTSEQRGLDAEVADTSGACLFPWRV